MYFNFYVSIFRYEVEINIWSKYFSHYSATKYLMEF